VIKNYVKQNHNKNSHPDKAGIPQFCIFNFDFCIFKLTVGQFGYLIPLARQKNLANTDFRYYNAVLALERRCVN